MFLVHQTGAEYAVDSFQWGRFHYVQKWLTDIMYALFLPVVHTGHRQPS